MEYDCILEMKEITKVFPGVKALDGAGLELRHGEVMALIGENGAGKSTLMKILLGIYSKDEGQIFFEGRQVDFRSAQDALEAGISMIHQEISLVPGLNVAENIWLGREKRFKRGGLINDAARDAATRELLDKLGLKLDIHAIVKDLSVAAMQLIELARAVSYDAKIIIMDEPTSALSSAEIELLFQIIRDLAGKGTAIIFVSHKLEEIFTICDRITVLRDGCFIDTCACADISQQELITLIAGREISQLFPKEEAEVGGTVLEVEHLFGMGFSDVSFQVHKGEILGFCGLVGAGRTEIMNAIFGITKAFSGTIRIDGDLVKIASPQTAIRHGIGMVTEDRLRMGVLHALPVKNNMSLAYLPTVCTKAGFVKERQERSDCQKEIEELLIRLTNLDVQIGGLSGGNQQKVIIGRWLLTQPKILIMDEPTRGIDVGAKSEIYKLISRLAQKGVAILMISSELPEILGMSDRILVIREGSIAGEFTRKEATQENLMQAAFGLNADFGEVRTEE